MPYGEDFVNEIIEKGTAEDNELPDDAFLYIEDGGEKDEEGKTVPRSLRHLPYKRADGSVDLDRLRNAIARLSQQNTGEVDGERWLTQELREQLLTKARRILERENAQSKLFIYKSKKDGRLRWVSISNVAIQDKEDEIVTEKAYDDAIEHARETGEFGPLDLVHVIGTEVGDCDFMARAGNRLIEGGTWRDSDLARRAIAKIKETPDRWGVSISFTFDPKMYKNGKYLGNIRILRRAVLPADMAASYGTKFIVKGVWEKMNENVIEALKELGLTPDEIAALAEKNYNEQESHVKSKFWERVFAFLRGQETTEAGDTTKDKQVGEELVKTISQTVVNAIAERDAMREKQVTELTQALTKLEQKFAMLQEEFARTQVNVEEKALELLNELPKVVKVRATQLTATEAQPIRDHGKAGTQTSEWLEEIKRAVHDAVRGSRADVL